MAVITYEIDTEHNVYPNITVQKRLIDGVARGWRFIANDGKRSRSPYDYVMYRTNATNTEYDEETGDEIPVTYYYRNYDTAVTYNWAWFDWVAVPENSVPEDYIFGGVDELKHEITEEEYKAKESEANDGNLLGEY